MTDIAAPVASFVDSRMRNFRSRQAKWATRLPFTSYLRHSHRIGEIEGEFLLIGKSHRSDRRRSRKPVDGNLVFQCQFVA